MYKILQNCYWG